MFNDPGRERGAEQRRHGGVLAVGVKRGGGDGAAAVLGKTRSTVERMSSAKALCDGASEVGSDSEVRWSSSMISSCSQTVPDVVVGADQQLARACRSGASANAAGRIGQLGYGGIKPIGAVAGDEAALQDGAADVGVGRGCERSGDPEPVGHGGGGAVADAFPRRGQAGDHGDGAPHGLADDISPWCDLFEDAVAGAGRSGRRCAPTDCASRVSIWSSARTAGPASAISREISRTHSCADGRRCAQPPEVTVVAPGLVAGLQVGLADVAGAKIGGAEQDQRAQRLVAVADGVAARLGQGVDEDGRGSRVRGRRRR